MFVCKECSYTFALNTSLLAHMLIHRGENIFLCEESFVSKDNLVKHMNSHKFNANNVSNNCQLILAIQLLASLRIQTLV